MLNMSLDDFLEHIGIKRRSGRYPWGSGSDPYQRSTSFKSFLEDLRGQGFSDTQIASYIQDLARKADPHARFTTDDLRAGIAISTEEIYNANRARAVQLKNEKQMSTSAIAELMLGDRRKESTVRGWLKDSEEIKEGSLKATANTLKKELETKPYLDVGKGQHLYLGVTKTKLDVAVAMLRDEGYEVWPIKTPQQGTGHLTTLRVLTKPGSTWSEANAAVKRGEFYTIASQSDDGGLTFRTPPALPKFMSSKKIDVRYAEDGGGTMDGVIELRRGVPELSLGANRYAQVRVAVDGTHFLKGMAMYADDLPDGVDIRYNTPKSKNDPKVQAEGKHGVMKPMNLDPDGKVNAASPFGSTTHPQMYVDKNGKEHQSVLNIVGSVGRGNIEGRWDEWSRNVSSQMLSKQSVSLASTQLAKARKSKQEDLDRILSLTNPVVKRQLLQEFADSADAAAVHLKAAAFDRQSTHVLLPMNSVRPNEIYAPNFENGERVVLVRHPHGGPFEIPALTVNNKSLTAKRIIGNAKDAVGIHHSVAEQLSGADFDGDTVLVIPNPSGKIKTRPPLEDLKGFDAKAQYKIPDGDTTTRRMTKQNLQTEMGKISNLITDMSIHNASDAELARAVKHSMVVIDAEKHGLDYRQSAKDNQIASLKDKYQKEGTKRGAATIISRASAKVYVPQLKQPSGKAGINPKTGEKILVPTGKTKPEFRIDKTTGERVPTGREIPVTEKRARAELAKDARSLVSKNPQPIEEVYAAHSNAMKALANQARKADIELTMPDYSPKAKAVYSKEVASLETKLRLAQANAPLERRAQVLSRTFAKERIDANPGLDDDAIRKIRFQSLEEARHITGADKQRIHIDEREWEAIQSHAISHTRLAEILRNADKKRVAELATPRSRSSLTPGQLARAKQLAALGRPMSQIAEELGIPRSTIVDNLNA